MTKYHITVMNENVPTMGNRLTRWLGRATLKIMGWKITGQFPLEKRLVFIGAPHTSNWDFIIAVAAMQAVGIRASWIMKKQAFFWPLGGLFKKMGGVPVDRSAKNNLIEQMQDWFSTQDKAYLGITPEGTRSKVDTFKTGYLRIAYAAKVPLFLVAIDAIKNEIVLDKLWPLTGNVEADNRAIKEYYDANYKGIRPELG